MSPRCYGLHVARDALLTMRWFDFRLTWANLVGCAKVTMRANNVRKVFGRDVRLMGPMEPMGLMEPMETHVTRGDHGTDGSKGLMRPMESLALEFCPEFVWGKLGPESWREDVKKAKLHCPELPGVQQELWHLGRRAAGACAFPSWHFRSSHRCHANLSGGFRPLRT